MRFLVICIPFAVLFMVPIDSQAQPNFQPTPAAKMPDEKTLKIIEEKREQLRKAIAEVKDGASQRGYADVAIYLKAVDWMVRHNDWVSKDVDKQTIAVADEGLSRVKLWKASLAAGKSEFLPTAGKWVARGYVSKIDGSVQPYAVSYPADYGKDANRKWRLDINLHGRDATINEVKFLAGHNGKASAKDQDYVLIDIYGRGNNAYRWAGEEDVLEVLDSFQKSEAQQNRPDIIDPLRIVLKGFSMGGAGTWHLGLQHPSKWAVMQPGAGFTVTHGYLPAKDDPTGKFPYPIEDMLTIYDAVLYAENAKNIPLVAYSGEIDGQKKAADNVEKELKKFGITMTHIIAPGLAHVAPKGEFTKAIETEFAKYIGPGKGKDLFPEEVTYVTYTLKFPQAATWLKLLGLDKHYSKARIHALRKGNVCTIETENISAFEISPMTFKITEIRIDGRDVPITTGETLWFEKKGKDWEQKKSDPTELPFPGRKKPGLTGPVDEAFVSGFAVAGPTKTGYFASTDTASKASLERFSKDWDKYFRGKLPMATGTPMDLNKNLVLFGDPQSNPTIAKVVEKLPLKWTAEKIVIAGKEFPTKDHLPIMIYPNPLNGGKNYVVINSGISFGEAEFKGTNALLYPRLGDYAVLKWDGKKFETVLNGLFDEGWRIPK